MSVKQIILLSFLLTIFFTCKSNVNLKKVVLVRDKKEIVCFIYHRFGDSRYPSTNTSVNDFEKHLLYLQRNNFKILSFSDAIAYLKSDEPVHKTAVITIDDGFLSFYKNGFPLLKKYKIPATLFINTKTVGGGDYMNWSALEEVTKTNIEIGNHSHSHSYFLNEKATFRYQLFKEEIELSQSLIFKNLHIKPVVFSYPYGEFDTEMKTIIKEAGFVAGAAQNSGVIGSETDLFQCPRFPMSEAFSSESKFIEKASSKALDVVKIIPDNSIIPDRQPLLTLSFDVSDLQLNRLQCFVQGGECNIDVIDTKKATITVRAKKPITKRRTLYTITIPDKTGTWHWYSHLWINASVK